MRRDAAAATAIYAALTIAFTWPLAAGLMHDIPGDFGDPLLNAWILAWDATHLTDGWRAWWNASIFHPHPLALAYSEHLFAQALQILPVYWLTGNPILCYNLLFLSTFVLSGLGMFLFVRELTGSRAAAFVAGLAYAFAPYRVGSLPHLQVLSSAWMPFVFYGFRRYFSTRRRVFLGVAAMAWVLQNLSCGYYLLFFAPVIALYLAWELTARGLWRNGRTMVAIVTTSAIVTMVTLPFLLPYLELRRLGFQPRSLVETQQFSADVYAYLTAESSLHAWGRIARAWPKAEGSLFPGLTIAALALWAALNAALNSRVAGRDDAAAIRDESAALRALPALAIAGGLAILVALLFGFSIRQPGLKVTSLERALAIAIAVVLATIAASRAARRQLADWLHTPAGVFSVLTLFAVVMSFGPEIHAKGRVVLDTNLYALFYRFVPGFDGLRVPARFGMLVALGLSVLAGLAVAEVARRARTPLLPVLAIAGVIAVESFAAPIPINESSPSYARSGLATLPPFEATAPPVYGLVRSLPPGSAIVELPLGEPAFDVRYMFYATQHWTPLVNGYTGGQPAEYGLLDQLLQDLFTRPERAWTALRGARPTHAIVHESYYADGRGPQVSQWLQAHGARELAAFGADRLFALP